MSERRCDWHGEVDHEAIGKRISDAVRAPQEAAPTKVPAPDEVWVVVDAKGRPMAREEPCPSEMVATGLARLIQEMSGEGFNVVRYVRAREGGQ